MRTLLFVLLMPCLALSQAKDINYLVVKGKAQVQVPLEFMEVKVQITNYARTVEAANDSNRALVLRAFKVFHQFGIADSDFQTDDNYSSDDRFSDRDEERHYSVSYSGSLTLKRPQVYDSLFQALVKVGPFQVNIIRFGSTRNSYYRMLAYQRAVEAARAEAQMIVKGSGQTVGRIIKLIQDNQDVFTEYDDIDKILAAQAAAAAAPRVLYDVETVRPSTFRRVSYAEDAEVTVIFEIK
jgi:uncharacterized protein YggE